jgi:hydrogenase maturation protease
VTVIGLGNELRRDDGAGLAAARRLRERGIDAMEHRGDPASLIDGWSGADAVIVIDAVSSGAAPGTIHRIDARATPLPAGLFKGSTHALGLAEAVELSRALGTLPGRVLVLGIEAGDLGAGVGLSPEVDRAVSGLVEEVASCTKRR